MFTSVSGLVSMHLDLRGCFRLTGVSSLPLDMLCSLTEIHANECASTGILHVGTSILEDCSVISETHFDHEISV